MAVYFRWIWPCGLQGEENKVPISLRRPSTFFSLSKLRIYNIWAIIWKIEEMSLWMLFRNKVLPEKNAYIEASWQWNWEWRMSHLFWTNCQFYTQIQLALDLLWQTTTPRFRQINDLLLRITPCIAENIFPVSTTFEIRMIFDIKICF